MNQALEESRHKGESAPTKLSATCDERNGETYMKRLTAKHFWIWVHQTISK